MKRNTFARATSALALLLAAQAPLGAAPSTLTEVPVHETAGQNGRARALIDQVRGTSEGRGILFLGHLWDTTGRVLSGNLAFTQDADRFLRETIRVLPGALQGGEGVAVVETRGAVFGSHGALDVNMPGRGGTSGPAATHRFSFPGTNPEPTRGASPAMVEVVQALAEGRRSVRVIVHSAAAEEIRADIEARRPILIPNLGPAGVNQINYIHQMPSILEMSEERWQERVRAGLEQDRRYLEQLGNTERAREGVAEDRRWRNLFTELREAHRAGLVTLWTAPTQVPQGNLPGEAHARLAEAIASALRGSETGPSLTARHLPARGTAATSSWVRNPLTRLQELAKGGFWGQGEEKSRSVFERLGRRGR